VGQLVQLLQAVESNGQQNRQQNVYFILKNMISQIKKIKLLRKIEIYSINCVFFFTGGLISP